MNFFLLRHGEADYQVDASGERPLTAQGAEHIRRLAKESAHLLADVQTIYCSPKLRARQTAQIVTEVVTEETNTQLPLQIVDELLPSATMAALETRLKKAAEQNVLLVTHQPLVGSFIDRLTDRTDLGHQMAPGTLASLQLLGFARGGATLEWLRQS